MDKVKNAVSSKLKKSLEELEAGTVQFGNNKTQVLTAPNKNALEKAAKTLDKSNSKISVTDDEGEEIAEMYPGISHPDDEGNMAKSQLLSIVKNARDIFNMIEDDTQLEGWVQSKITKAEDYLQALASYLQGQAVLSSKTDVTIAESKKKKK